MTVEIEKISESHIRVMGNESDEADIKRHFTFKAPGYKFHPKVKAGLWNGDISLYDMRSKRLPIGLYPRLQAFLEQSNTNIAIRENKNYFFDENQFTYDEVKTFVEELDLALPNGSSIRDYQLDAVYKAISEKKITLISPTSSGKSLILYCIIRWILDQNPHAKIILMVPTVQLVNQMASDFVEYSSNNGFDVEKYMQKLFSGQPRELTKNLLITTWQSLKNVAANQVAGNGILSTYNAVLADEAHCSKGTEVQAILEKCRNAVYRIGTTGTLDNEKVHQLMIEGYLGPVYKVITTKELIDTKQVSALDLKCFSLKYPEDICKAFKKMSYDDELTFLIGLQKRNEFIAKMASACSGATLVLTRFNGDHAKPLYELISSITEKPVYYVSGEIKAEQRESIRKVANMEDCIIVATIDTMGTGVNIPNLRNVIFASPTKSMIKVLQSIGRGLRLAEGKEKMVLIDIIDDIRYKKKENFAYIHALERISIYRREQFEFTVKEIPFAV
jgi:superfamily II DNA or RNA helicase